MPACLISIFLAASILAGDGSALLANEVSLAPKTQAVISLDEAIRLVKRAHPDIRLQEAAVAKASDEVQLAARAFLPDFDVDFIAGSASGGWGLILTAAKLLGPVFSFRKIMTEREARKILKEKEELLLRHRSLEVVYGVKELFVMLLIQRELARILAEQAARAKERFELVAIYHEEGRLNGEELLAERLRFETASTEAAKASAWLHSSEFAFARLLALPRGAVFMLAPFPPANPDAFPLKFEECLLVAYERNALVSALFLEEEASLRRLGVKEPLFRSGGAFLGLGEAGNGLFSGRPRFGFTGNLVLYDWGKRRLLKKIKGLEHVELTLKHEKEFRAFEEALAKSYFELERLRHELSASQAKSELVRESERRGRILESMGRLRQTEFLLLENERALQEIEDLRKRLECFLAGERLLKDMGLSSLDDLKGVPAP